MASAVIAGIAAYSYVGTTAFYAYAAVAAVAAAGATYAVEQSMKPDTQGVSSQVVTLGDKGTAIDKSALQQQGDAAKLALGEDAKDKAKRKKGKAGFKIALDQAAAETTDKPIETGLTVKNDKSLGVQL